MPIRTLKTTKYVTSDGTEFVGFKNKPAAILYEKNYLRRIKKYTKDFQILEKLNNPRADKILLDYNKILDLIDPVNAELRNSYSEDCVDLIHELFNEAMCPDDLNDLSEMVDMISFIIDNFGGIEIIHKLYISNKAVIKRNS